MPSNHTRRAYLGALGTVGLAGCSDGTSTPSGNATGTGNGTTTAQQTPLPSPDFDGYLSDLTGRDTITVEVGVPGNGGAFAFDPPASSTARRATHYRSGSASGGPWSSVTSSR
jgi:hypothetical protein